MRSPRLGWCGIGFALLLSIRSVAAEYYVATDGSDQAAGTAVDMPFATLTKAFKVAGPGDAIFLRGGTYRELVQVSSGGGAPGAYLTVQAYNQEVPVIKGSNLVSGWEPHEGAIWKKTGWQIRSHQVFCNDQWLQEIGLPSPNYTSSYVPVGTGLSDMYPGSFYYDSSATTLYVWLPDGSDPNLSTMEVSSKIGLLWMEVPFVHVKGLKFRHSNSSRDVPGGIAVILGPDSVIEDCDIQWCDFEGLELRDRCVAQNCIISNNGDVGVGAGGRSDFVVRRCVIQGNNYRNFKTGWHAGGMKFVPNANGTVEECDVSNNNGNAIWFDWCKNGKPIVIRGNFVSGNLKTAIFIEGSADALVYNNQLVGNRERGLYISGSDRVKFYHNTVVGTSGFAAVSLGGVPRTGCSLTNNEVLNNIVSGNTCLYDLLVPPENGGDVVGNVSNFNCLFRNGDPLRLNAWGPTWPDLASWRNATGLDLDSISENPQFMLATPEDFSTSPMSPVVDRGVSLPEVIEDIRGLSRPQGGGPDMGAYETSWQDLQAPAAPQNLTVTALGWNSFQLAWNASSDNVGVAYYDIYRDGVRYATSTETVFCDSNLPELRTFQYFIVAIDQAGLTSSTSNVVAVSTGSAPDTIPPTVPQKVNAVPQSASSIAVSWEASKDNVGVVKYKIYRNDVKIAETAATWFTDTGLRPKSAYNYKISALDAAGNESGLSKAKPVKTAP